MDGENICQSLCYFKGQILLFCCSVLQNLPQRNHTDVSMER